jgi:Domain of unknown function (DUF4249)
MVTMRVLIQFLFYSIFFVEILFSCVEPYNINLRVETAILTIDGNINDQSQEQLISIRKTLPSTSFGITFIAEEKAKVEIVEDSKNTITCIEGKSGNYYLPLGFKTKLGSNYLLKVSLKDGKMYESTLEKMLFTPEILKSTVVFDKKAIQIGENNRPGHLVYVDTKDNPEKGDNILWKYRLYEKQDVCISCDGGIYNTAPSPFGICRTVADLAREGVTYDYLCSGNCWEILYSTDINVISDAFSNGNEINNRLVARVPYYQNSGFLIEVSQQNVSTEAFQFLKILIDQNQNNGSLIDSPPSPLIGNIKNINDPKEAVGGYFMVGNVKTKKIWVPRTEGEKTIGLLGGRPISEEPASPFRPPTAPCVKSNTRTPLKPEGWPI